jgi:pimeloyl-[acyl-carrier protein] synthase
MMKPKSGSKKNEAEYSLFQLLKPGSIADPYPLYQKLREYEPVHWDPFMHSWVVTSYAECVTALTSYKAARTPTPEHLDKMGLSVLGGYAALMLKQILFMDQPSHGHFRSMCQVAFTPKRVQLFSIKTEEIANDILDRLVERGSMDMVTDFAIPFPALVLAALMGLPPEDVGMLKTWVSDLSELIGNFEHDVERITKLVYSVEQLRLYIAAEVAAQKHTPLDGVISGLISAEVNGVRLTDEEIVANTMLMIAAGLEESTNLIGCGIFSLLNRPEKLAQLRDNPEIASSAVEEFLRFESPTQHTGRLAPEDTVLSGKQIREGDLVTVVLGAANRDPLRFNGPDELDLIRTDNRHLAFGWASHYCIGAALARSTGKTAFTALLGRLPDLAFGTTEPQWRTMAALRGIASLPVEFDAKMAMTLQAVG